MILLFPHRATCLNAIANSNSNARVGVGKNKLPCKFCCIYRLQQTGSVNHSRRGETVMRQPEEEGGSVQGPRGEGYGD